MIPQVKVSDFTEVITGGTPSTTVDEYWESGKIPWLNSGELNKKYIYDAKNFITEAGLKSSSTKLMPAETVLIALTGATCGLSALMKIEACANQSVTGILPSEKHSPDYLLHFLKTQRKRILDKAWGNAQPHISQKFVKDLLIPLPTLTDQLHIANLLSKAENLISKRKESIRLLDEFLKSTFLEMFGDPVRNKKGFKIRNLTEFYVNPKEGTKCGPFGSALKKDEYTESGIPVWIMDNILKSGEFNEKGCLFVSEEKHRELERYNAINDDIIISRAGTVGKMCIIKTNAKKSLISTNLIRLRLSQKLKPIFFFSLMRYCQSRLIKLKHGNEDAYTHMSTGVLDEINFPFPPIALQTQFAQIVQKSEALKTQYQQSLRELENLYGSLSQKAFRGELTLAQKDEEILMAAEPENNYSQK